MHIYNRCTELIKRMKQKKLQLLRDIDEILISNKLGHACERVLRVRPHGLVLKHSLAEYLDVIGLAIGTTRNSMS